MKNLKIVVFIFHIILLGQSRFALGQQPLVERILSDVKLDTLTKIIKQLSGELPVLINGRQDTIKSRFAYNIGNEKAFVFMRDLFVSYGLTIDSIPFSSYGKNLFGIKTGYMYPNMRYYIGAHYDNTRSFGTAPGADDNASGTAAVIEAARIFSKYDFPYTIIFALWDEEELSSRGSKYYATTIKGIPGTFLGYINLDMLGWDGNNDTVADIHVMPIANSLQLMEKAEKCNLQYNIGLKIHVVNPGDKNTDHASFWENDLTAIGIDEEYDKDFNPSWHTPADSLGNFNLNFFERCAKLAYATLADVALDASTAGTSQGELKNGLHISPNPFQSYTAISFDGTIQFPLQIQVVDLFGRTILESSVENNNFRIEFPESVVSGVYYLKIYKREITDIYKIIKY